MPQHSGAINLPDFKASPSFSLNTGETIDVTIDSDSAMYYPGVSYAWEQQAQGHPQAKVHAEVVHMEVGEYKWGSCPGTEWGYSGSLVYQYTGDSDKHIEIVLSSTSDNATYRLMLFSLDESSSHSVSYKIAKYTT
jgi:hypothetical protein